MNPRQEKSPTKTYEMPDVEKQVDYYTGSSALPRPGKTRTPFYLASTVAHHSVVAAKGRRRNARGCFSDRPRDDLGAFEKQVQGHGVKTPASEDPDGHDLGPANLDADPTGTVMRCSMRDRLAGHASRKRAAFRSSSATSLPRHRRQAGDQVLLRRLGFRESD